MIRGRPAAASFMCESLLQELELPPFRPRAPWWGADLQTLRDTLRPLRLDDRSSRSLELPIGGGERLLVRLDLPPSAPPRGLVLLCHGLGGSSESVGTQRLALRLGQEGLAVLRLNLRGAGAGRALAAGSYAAACNSDLLPVLNQARDLAAQLNPGGAALPLAGAGISLGGTILLNAAAAALHQDEPGLDALACLSSPLDLGDCSSQFEHPRNHLYQRWLVNRLRRQVLDDPHGLGETERRALRGPQRPRSIRSFDALITAPRWGYGSVEQYYAEASPLHRLNGTLSLPPTLLLHAADDPWVPAAPALALAGAPPEQRPARLEICITRHGGHNGFHGVGDNPEGSWSDRLTARWLRLRLGQR